VCWWLTVLTRGLCTLLCPETHDFRSPDFPLFRVKKIMKMDPDVKVGVACSGGGHHLRGKAAPVSCPSLLRTSLALPCVDALTDTMWREPVHAWRAWVV
jgi:hypothetical protein